jgi:valine dehydrogenase (NAD+)
VIKHLDPGGANDHEEVVYCEDAGTGLRSIVAIHSTRLGPSLGGTRFFPFAGEDDALADVLRLSRAMSYKSAAAGLDHGGGKAVIIGDPRRDRTEALIRSYARFVDSLGGRYITTEDVGTTEADMNLIATETRFVTGMSTESGGSGDPSEATAWGVFCAMRTLARGLWQQESLEGRHVAVQGVGKVGSYLVGQLVRDGCVVTVADVNVDAVARLNSERGLSTVAPQDIHKVRCEIFSPCALADSLSERTIPELDCAAVVGCANNQLASPGAAELLADRGIVYAPDFIVNAGGVINVAHELIGYDRERAYAHTARIGETLERVLDLAEKEGITTAAAADRIAEQRLRPSRER